MNYTNCCIFYGRMQPIHRAHQLVIQQMAEYAKSIEAEAWVAMSGTQDPVKNPLNFNQKLKYAEAVCQPLGVNVWNKPVIKIYDLLRDFAFKCQEAGGGQIILFCGDDRVDSYQRMADSMIKKYQSRGECLNVSIEIDSAMNRDSSEAYSATQMRQLAADDNFEEFAKHSAFNDPQLQLELFQDLQKGMSILVENFIKNSRSRLLEAQISKSPAEVKKITEWMAEEVNKHLNQLTGKPDKLYYVGGCVRDLLMGKTPNDFDLLTTMYYKDYAQLFETTDIRFRGKQIVVVPKIDGEEMETGCLKKNELLERNLSERDLTINSMAMDIFTGKIIDPCNGQEDIKNEVLEIPLFRRELIAKGQYPTTFFRVIRFFSQLGWKYSKETWKAIQSFAEKTNYQIKISERQFLHDWEKFVKGRYCRSAVQLLIDLGFDPYLRDNFPEWEKYVDTMIVAVD